MKFQFLPPFSKLASSALALGVIGLAAPVFADNLVVESGASGTQCTVSDPCGSIQLAVDVAADGDVVSVGPGTFVENIYVQTPNVSIKGRSFGATTVISAGGRAGATGNAGNPLDAVFEVRAPGVSFTDLRIVIPDGKATKRDAGIFAWAGSNGLVVDSCKVERNRDARIDEPTTPGSRKTTFIFPLVAFLLRTTS